MCKHKLMAPRHPGGRPPKPGGATAAAPVLYLRLDAETEASLAIIKFERQTRTLLDAARLAIRFEAVRLAGRERVERATEVATRKRRPSGNT